MYKSKMFRGVVSGHFAVDVLNSTGAVLLAVLKEPLGLSYAQIGTALTLYLLVGSLSQPLFGWLADKAPGRTMLLASLSVVWMALFFTMVAFAPTWALLLPVFLLAPLGSGLFHPIGASAAAISNPERAASATSVFFFFGQFGLALGPFIAGALFSLFGAAGLLPLTALALIPAALLLLASAEERAMAVRKVAQRATRAASWTGLAVALIAAFVLLVATRSSLQAIFQLYLPQLFESRGWSPTLFGLMAGVFMGAGAVGQVVTGNLADRYGVRAATFWPLLLTTPLGLLCLISPSAWGAFVACAAFGLLAGGQHSVLVVHAQRLLPVKQGFAAGLILGFTFASGAIGTWLAGQFADGVGLETVMLWATVLGLPCALLALSLPGRQRPAAVAVPAPAGD
jgi:FSR family fosmidomycin resistance protein-like MFS transporter